jgi:branched-chain amino acid transport system substrate-binding protein
VRSHYARVLSVALVLAALPLTAGATATPGLTSSAVSVGAIVTQSGGIAASFKPYLSGVQAYFDYQNALGGVNHRKINLNWSLDDAGNPTTTLQDAQTLVLQDHVFALVGASTPFFSSASKFLVKQNVPTFGFSTGAGWDTAKNLFAAYGSQLNYASAASDVAYVATKEGKTTAAFIALNWGPSQQECEAAAKGVAAYGVKVAYSNFSEPVIGAQFTTDAVKMAAAHVDFVFSCMDVTSNLALSQSLSDVGLAGVHQLWEDGYDRDILRANSTLMQNVVVLTQHVPFEATTPYPKAYAGMNLYLAQMQKYGFISDMYSDVALQGWMGANLFVQGLMKAGANPTPASVITAINTITNDTGNGVTTPINWTKAHTTVTSPGCDAFVTTTGSGNSASYTPVFNRGPNVWICFPLTGKVDIKAPVAPPPGSPGA